MTSYSYLDGSIVSSKHANLPVTDLGLQRGYGVFDFMRTYNGHIFHPFDHLERFRASASELSLEIPLSDDKMVEIGNDLLERSNLEYPALKFILTGGDETPDSPTEQPRLMIIAQNRPVFPESVYSKGAHLLTFRHRRELPHVKTLNYLNSLRLHKRKQENDALDLLYYDQENDVTESPQANVFIAIHDGNKLVTPSNGILKGITRKTIMDLSKPYFNVEVRPVTIDELQKADECFICSTSKRIIPVTRLDSSPVGKGSPGKATRRMMQLLDDYTSSYS